MDWICSYCGSKATAASGKVFWCSSCCGRHAFATWEPHLLFRLPPSPVQQLGGWFAYQWFRFIGMFVPVRWILIEGESRRTKLAIWVHGGAYFYEMRASGDL